MKNYIFVRVYADFFNAFVEHSPSMTNIQNLKKMNDIARPKPRILIAK